MPFKDTAVYLPECLDSILAQTYAHWEVLAVNDHSQDASCDIVADMAQKDSRIKWYHNEGQGIIPALRTAYAHSSGTYITRMDSDDIMVPEKLEVMVRQLQQYGPGHIAVGQVRYFSHRGISDGYARYETWINGLTALGANFSDIYKECVIPSPCWMVHRTDLNKCGAFDRDRYPEDYDLTFRFYKGRLKCLPNRKLLHYWRDYDTRTSRTHEHYAQNYFLDIKLHYFLMLDYDSPRPLVVWGAGNKGKAIAKGLIANGLNFNWLCDNPKKIGKKIYGQPMVHFSQMETLQAPQSIITVANEKAQKEIRDYLGSLDQKPGADYFFFC
ncbi:MAG: glycosyltransferase [Flavobacteriaceae bacterium]